MNSRQLKIKEQLCKSLGTLCSITHHFIWERTRILRKLTGPVGMANFCGCAAMVAMP